MAEHKRLAYGELKSAMRAFLAQKHGGPASIPEIREAVERELGPVPQSSVRSGLQDERYFERLSRGVFRLRAES